VVKLKRSFRGLMLISSFLAACMPSRADTEAEPAPVARSRAPVSVRLAPVISKPLELELLVLGRVTHARDLRLAFKTGGVVAELLVEEGERVTRGQVLARLDKSELKAGLAQARAGLDKAKRDLARVRGLESQAVLPGSTREDAETARVVAAAQVRGLHWNLETATITADCDGVVLKRLAEPGEVVGPGQPILVVGDESAGVRVEFGLPARDLDRVAIGESVTVRLDGTSNSHPSTIVDLAPTLSPGTDRLSVYASLPPTLRPPRGLVATVTLPARSTPTLPAIPLSAVVEGEGREASVWLLASQSSTSSSVERASEPREEGAKASRRETAPSQGPAEGTNAGGSPVVRRTITIHSIREDGMVLVERGLEDVTQVIDAGQAWLDATATVVVKGSR
jgi:RND family efflux transporter MFP subunit